MEEILFGEVIKNLREEKGLSIRKASEGIGISHTYLDSLEKGYDPRTKKKRKPTPEVIKKISDFYNLTYEDLMIAAGYMEEPLSINDMMDNLKSKTNGKYHSNEIYYLDLNDFFIDDDYKLETRRSTIKLIPKYKNQELTKEDLKKINKFVEAYLED